MTRWTDKPEHDQLVDSAIRTLVKSDNTFEVLPWRDIMRTIHIVKQTTHIFATPELLESGAFDLEKSMDRFFAADPFNLNQRRRAADMIDSVDDDVVESGFQRGNPAAPSTGESTMNQTTQSTAQDEAARITQAKIAAKAKKLEEAKAKKEAAEKAKAEKEALKAQKAAEAEQAKKDRAEKLAAERAAKAEAKEKAAAEKQARIGTPDADRVMTALQERIKAGAYVKGANGQLRCSDAVALALDHVPPTGVISIAKDIFELDENPYAHLNLGQQSMNFRNRLRGAINKGTKVGEKVVTLELLEQVRDGLGYAAPAPEPEGQEGTTEAHADTPAEQTETV